MQATARTPRRRLHAKGTVGAAGAAAAAAAAAANGVAAAVAAEPPGEAAVCRICWAEQDAEAGGALLAPCRCSGSQRFVHERCLRAWTQSVAERKGAPQARRCDICRAPYRGLPRSLRIREAPVQAARRHALALLDSPAGWVASYYAAGGLVFSVGLALHGAWQRLGTLHAVMAAMQLQPLHALRLLGPDLALAVLSEACLSGHWLVPLQSAVRIVQGVLLQLGAGWARERAASVLPGLLLPVALFACSAVNFAGKLVQYTNTGLVLLFGGLTRGFARGGSGGGNCRCTLKAAAAAAPVA
ncbi:hypothetical protein ABPG77_005011 [Micractinium sp. CCAP 211/92]